MESPRFKRNVMRTMLPKTVKFGLRNLSRNTISAQVMYAVSGLNNSVTAFMVQMRPFLLGYQLNQSYLQQAFPSMGEVCYYTVILARLLKLKVPGAGKKVKLSSLVPKGESFTKTEAILKLHEVAGIMLWGTSSVFSGEGIGTEVLKLKVSEIMSVLWPLIYELFGVPPAVVFEDFINRLSSEYPENLFSDDAALAKEAIAKMKEDEKEMISAHKGSKDVDTAALDASTLDGQEEGTEGDWAEGETSEETVE